MDAASPPGIMSSSLPSSSIPARRFIVNHHPFTYYNLLYPSNYKPPILLHRNVIVSPIAVVNHEISAITSSDPDITWQILIGALAGVIPFVVAGIEFTKRIVEQRNCKVCKGSGLVLRDAKYYFRCPRCGGFLPWQSWRRFFTG